MMMKKIAADMLINAAKERRLLFRLPAVLDETASVKTTYLITVEAHLLQIQFYVTLFLILISRTIYVIEQ